MTEELTEQRIRNIIKEELTSSGASILKLRENLDYEVFTIKKDLKKYINDMFSNADFTKRFQAELFRYIDQEVKSSLSESHLGEVIKEKIKYILKDSLKDIIANVVKEVVEQTNRKLKSEYEVAKELSYSVESMIKHTLRDSPISYNNEIIIKEKIIGLLDKIEVKNHTKKLEDKR